MTNVSIENDKFSIGVALRVFLLSAAIFFSGSFVETISFDSQISSAQKTRKVESIRQKHVKTFEKISEYFDQEDVAGAKRELDKLGRETDLNNIESAYLWNFQGSICLNQDNLNCALNNFKKVANLKEGISEGFQNQMLYQVAQVLFLQEKYREALQYAQRWFRTQEDPSADAYMLIGQAHYQLKEYDKALPNVQKGIKKYEELGSTPKEGWFKPAEQHLS